MSYVFSGGRSGQTWVAWRGRLLGGLLVLGWPGAAGAEQHLDSLEVGGITYSNVTMTEVSPTEVFFQHAGGMMNVKLKELDPKVRRRLQRTTGEPEMQFIDYNCAITLPKGYSKLTEDAPPGSVILGSFVDSARSWQMILMAYDITSSSPINDPFVAGFEKALREHGDERLAGRFVMVDGIRSYEHTGVKIQNGGRISSIIQVVPVEGRAYILKGLSSGGDAGNDPRLRAMLDSFHFLRAPVPVPASAIVPDGDVSAAAYQTGKLLGRLAVFGVIAVGLIGGGTLTVLAIVRSRRELQLARSPRSPLSNQPPPLPPKGRSPGREI